MRACSERGTTMQYRLLTSGRLLGIGALALLAFGAGSLLTSGLSAQPPTTLPQTLKVLEQNLDGNGFIKVHEQGTASVTGTVAVTGGSIGVSNFPSTLNVHQAPVIGALTFNFAIAADGSVLESFATINATAIQIFAPDDEIQVLFQSPLSSFEAPGTGTNNVLFRLLGDEGQLESFIQTFPQPVPLNGVRIFCQN